MSGLLHQITSLRSALETEDTLLAYFRTLALLGELLLHSLCLVLLRQVKQLSVLLQSLLDLPRDLMKYRSAIDAFLAEL